MYTLINVEIYTELPIGYYNNYNNNNNNNLVYKLNKALYGLKQSPCLWYKHLTTILTKLGFIIFPYNKAIFIYITYKIIIIYYVNDLIIIGPNKDQINKIIKEVNKDIKL